MRAFAFVYSSSSAGKDFPAHLSITLQLSAASCDNLPTAYLTLVLFYNVITEKCCVNKCLTNANNTPQIAMLSLTESEATVHWCTPYH